MTTPKPTRGSVGPGTLDQELQEHKGLHQNRITSKGPSDFQGNQKAKVAAAKGLLPHKDHRGPGATGAQAGGATRGSSQKVQGLLEPQGLQQPQAPTGGLQRTRGPKAAVKDHYQPGGAWAPRPDVLGHRGPGPGLCTSRYVTLFRQTASRPEQLPNPYDPNIASL